MRWKEISHNHFRTEHGDFVVNLYGPASWITEIKFKGNLLYESWESCRCSRAAKLWATKETKWFLLDLKRQVTEYVETQVEARRRRVL